MSLEVSAVSSMNYMFLRFTVKKPHHDNEIIVNELQNFVTTMHNDDYVSQESKKVIRTELVEGDYFTGKLEKETRELLEEATKSLVGEVLPNVVNFYVNLAKEMEVLADD